MEAESKEMTFPQSGDNWAKQRKANIGDKVVFSGRKNKPSQSGIFVKQHLNHRGSVLSHKVRMANTGLSMRHYYLLKCDDCVGSDPDWVMSQLFDKTNI